MKCSKCGEELNEKWSVCPFCGTEVSKAPKTIEEVLSELVKDYGPEIFKEEYNNRLGRCMDDWPETFADDRDVIKLMQIKNIPGKLSCALEMPKEKQGEVMQECSSLLCDKFGINGGSASKMLSLITNAIGLNVENVAVGAGLGTFTDPRDGRVYKTCKIGNQTWLAENLKYETAEGCSPYDDDWQYFDKYGLLYNQDSAIKACPEGWHIPSEAEFETLVKYVKKKMACKDASIYLKSKEWGGEDSVGFNALPAGYESGMGFSSLGEMAVFMISGRNDSMFIADFSHLNDVENAIVAEINSLCYGCHFYSNELYIGRMAFSNYKYICFDEHSMCSVRLIKDES